MNEEPRSEAQAAPKTPESSNLPPPPVVAGSRLILRSWQPKTPESSDPPPPPAVAGSRLPAWLPYFLLAVVPAVVVGILVFVFAGGNGTGGGNAAAIVEMFFAPPEDSNTRVESFKGTLPPDFPAEFPLFDDSEPVASFAVATPQGRTFTVVLISSATSQEIFAFYRDALDSDPWQVEVGQIGAQITGIRYARPDNPDVSGVVIVNESELDERTVIQLVYEDLAGALTPGTGPSVPQLGQSRPLPLGFPEAVPIYGADDGTIVIDSGFQRGQGGQFFAVTFLTLDSEYDVIDYYRGEFEARDWTVTESTDTDLTSFAVAIEFDDGEAATSGQIIADTYSEDADYTRVDLIVQVSGRTSN